MKNRYVRHAHISEGIFRKVLKLFCADIPALTAAGLVGLSVQSTQRLYDGLRLRIMELTLKEARPFVGEVEIDESYFGARRVRGKRGRGAAGKTPVTLAAQTQRQSLHRHRRELLQTSADADHQGPGAFGSDPLHRRLEVLRRPGPGR